MGLSLSTLLKSTAVCYLEDALKLLEGGEDASTSTVAPPRPIIPGSKGKAPAAGGSKAAGTPPGTPRGALDWAASASAASPAVSEEEWRSGAVSPALPGGQQQGAAGVSQASLAAYKQRLELARQAPGQVEGTISDLDQRLLRNLIAALHRREASPAAAAAAATAGGARGPSATAWGAILVFLPTYRTLELQHELLLATGLPFAFFALHSSIDIDECVVAMQAAAPGRRKVILATNIAESSVTIPGVMVVIDCCRTLEMRWERHARRTQPRIIFASRSQCDQCKGRTGRTCDGAVYRLLPRKVFLETLPAFEAPHLTLLHLRRKALGLLCAASGLMNNPPSLLRRCLTPPQPETAADALAYLATLGAAAGLLRPAVVLAAILNVNPSPIHQPFASAQQYKLNLQRYGGPDADPADAQSVLLANLAACLFWEAQFCDKRTAAGAAGSYGAGGYGGGGYGGAGYGSGGSGMSQAGRQQQAGRHVCSLAPAPRRWGTDALSGSGGGAAAQQCVAPCAKLPAYYDQQSIKALEELVLSKDLDPSSLGGGQRYEEDLGYGSYGLPPMLRRPPPLCRFFVSTRGCT
ncbi:zinc finger CCCH domain-containing 31 isoform A [Micractinium conductrix]|uniref:Zinc finger CCCH domain-containing 31 isoform A n=1 Tax=Micractinium conductrix TaxID=554055 RepID=A0A2P6VMM7_9CHLO|nr:zinc finger CCCH domain-containing 31 isoform B [Micractinium conductrix]PSC75349.1 zinc finger CCCH domain-containing 31 isoform A [Micractinium conductrix]|eukprot:PSC75348.1 zinc finger CCCH domain-containing 31 isoform B [Micractinium conductrix]